jgi:hypothetical protein
VERVFFLPCILTRVDCKIGLEISKWMIIWLYTLKKISLMRLIIKLL